MTDTHVRVRELMAWGLDQNSFRPHVDALPTMIERARHKVSCRNAFKVEDPISFDVPSCIAELLAEESRRVDLHAEMNGLDWSVGIVNLRHILSFQRRLVFDDSSLHSDIPTLNDWSALAALAFGPPVPIAYRTLTSDESTIVLQSENPNFQVRRSIECCHHPFQFHGGSPFFEVAAFEGRWFLRDGYHRAYRLLRAGIAHLPAVVVRARTLSELGPVQPWFFSKEALFNPAPPRLIDFLDDDLTIEYTRPRLFKTLRVSIQESVEPASPILTSGESQ